MAVDKRSYLRTAQKQVQKGQLDRAIVSYKAVLKVDPNDVKVHNALGDTYIRLKKKGEGIKEYLWVADYYEKDRFYLRSIAICQKILNIDDSLIEVRQKLANLYVQQKLLAEAKKQYLQLADYYDKKGDVTNALETLGKIADLDPSNLGVRIKLGKMYKKQGLPGKAAEEYVRAAEGHIKLKQYEKAADLLRSALELNPESPGARLCFAEYHANREEWPDVVRNLARIVTDEAVDLDVLKLYAGACARTGQDQEAIAALEKALEKEPTSRPLKTLLGRAYLQERQFDKAYDLYAPAIGEYLKEKKEEAAEDLARQLTEAFPDSARAQQQLLEVVQQKGDQGATLLIYRRLGEIYQAKGLTQNAVGALERYLELSSGDEEVSALVTRLRGEEATAPGQGPEAEVPAETVPAPDELTPVEEDVDVEMFDFTDLSDEELAVEIPQEEMAEAGAPGAASLETGVEGLEEELVIESEEVDTVLGEAGPPGPAAAEAPSAALSEEPSPGDEVAGAPRAAMQEPELPDEVDLEEGAFFSTEEVIPAMREAADGVEAPAAGTEKVDEGLSAELVLGDEVPAGEPESGPEKDEEAPVLTEGLDFDLSALNEPAPPDVAVAEEPPADEGTMSEEMEEFLAEADFYFQQGLHEEAEFLYLKLSKIEPDNPILKARLQRLEGEKTRSVESAGDLEPAGAEVGQDAISALESDLDRVFDVQAEGAAGKSMRLTVSGDATGGDEGLSDFMSELRKELESEEPRLSAPVVDGENSLSEIFQEFQEGLKEQLDEEDFETHYNLGIAYKEMGLMEEALGEFVLSEKSEARRLDSLSMIALCLRDMGRDGEAIAKLEEGLQQAEEGSDEQKGFLYELAGLYERTGRKADADELLERLSLLDPSYRDLKARLQPGDDDSQPVSSQPQAKEMETTRPKKPKVSYL